MKFFKQKSKETEDPGKPVLVFDFGSESIKILHCRYFKDTLKILNGKKVLYPVGSIDVDDIIRPEELTSVLNGAVLELVPEGPRKVGVSAVVGIGGLGMEGYTSQITYRRAMEKKIIEPGEFKNVVKRVQERAGEMMSKMVAWETAAGQEMTVVNSEILDIVLDGYSVASPVGSSGQKLSFLVYNAYFKAAQLKNLIECVRNLGLEIISVSSSIYSLLRLVAEEFNGHSSILVLDIGGKSTDVGVISAGRILGHINFDAGGGSFTESIAAEFRKRQEEAEKWKLGFAGAKLPESVMKEIREIIVSDCKVYFSGVELVLKEFPGLQALPNQICVAGGGSLLPGVVPFLQSAEWTSGSERPRTEMLVPKTFKGFEDVTGKINSAADVPTLAIALDARDLVGQSAFSRSLWEKFSKGF